ncbi:MAG: hypothetical protein A2142_07155 [candidate division Zixibacteria bacterium RBG_16_48_11]|nr:MAG: hypothetical protein A2142_07155 [candidate division Zixibacteria bacterium RBG_16_48_11]
MRKWHTVRNKAWLRALSYLIIVLVFYFLLKSLYQNWGNIAWSKLHFKLFYLLMSGTVVFLSYAISIYSWKLVLAEIGERVSYLQALKILGKSQLGKYLPGGIWMTASRLYLAEQEGLSKSRVLLASVVEQEYVFVTALVLSILFLGFHGSLLELNLSGLNLLFLLLALLFLNPLSLTYLLKLGMRLFRLEYQNWRFGLRLYLILVLGYGICWILQGLGFFLLAKSFYDLDLGWLKTFIGIYLSSWVIGFVAIFAPGGLGIREGSLALFLQGSFPTGLAVSLSLLSRVWTTILELLLFILAFIKKPEKPSN